MAMIKSALELALEKTKDLEIDEAALEMNALRVEGKRAAGRFLEDPESASLGDKLAAYPKEKRAALRQGIFEVLVAQLQLPTNDGGIDKVEVVAKACLAISGSSGIAGAILGSDKKVQSLFQQLSGFFRQYLEEMKNVEQIIRKQWAPKLREKEREMSARMGQDVRIDPMMDPEFSAFYKQNVGAVRQQYQAALEKAKKDLAVMMGIEAE